MNNFILECQNLNLVDKIAYYIKQCKLSIVNYHNMTYDEYQQNIKNLIELKQYVMNEISANS